MAEEACGLYNNAFTDYPRLRAEWKAKNRREGQTDSALDFAWTQTGVAKECVSDLNTYSVRAQVFAAMANMKYQRAIAAFAKEEFREAQASR